MVVRTPRVEDRQGNVSNAGCIKDTAQERIVANPRDVKDAGCVKDTAQERIVANPRDVRDAGNVRDVGCVRDTEKRSVRDAGDVKDVRKGPQGGQAQKGNSQ